MEQKRSISRRSFLRRAAAAGAGVALAEVFVFEPWHLEASQPVSVNDPFTVFPDRGWEQAYRDLFTPDSDYVFTCAPNDTHNCLLRAHVKNGVVVRISPTYGYGEATDLHGNKASHRWDPRCCQKGLALARKFYGDRRVRGAMVRAGFKEWADAGFPRDEATGRPLQDMERRGRDTWVKVPWDEAFDLAARAYLDIARAYSGEAGAERLTAQGYDPAMVEAAHEAGTQLIKVRGGMPLLGIYRIYSFYRFANMLALLDDHVRQVGPDEALGGRGWDSYTWHTDLPPGHPMVTGHQTVEFDLFAPEYADLVVTFGMNWISTKMPDGHWLSEARQKGTRIINVSTDYQSTSNRSDEVIMIRPGTDAALALGCAQYILANGLHDEDHIKAWTDLPLLVRMDTHQLLNARDVVEGYEPAPLDNFVQVVADGAPLPAPAQQGTQYVSESLRAEWGDFMVWDERTNEAVPVTRDQVGDRFRETGVEPALDGEFAVTLLDGSQVSVQPVFGQVKRYLDENFDLATTSEVTWAPPAAIESLAKQVASARGKTLLATGMGPNHYFNADLKDRAIFLLAALTDNVGHIGGNVGAYAGNYRGSIFNGIPQWIKEDPFNPELDAAQPATVRSYYKGESAHFYNYGDRPLRGGTKNFTGETHMPTPTKAMLFGNSNSLLGNAKWHHDVVHNTLPGIEAIFVNEWWWTASCEYADIVFGVDSWGERKNLDATGSCTNSFLHMAPRSPLDRIYDTRGDAEVMAGISEQLAALTGDSRFRDYWTFLLDGRDDVYLQRIFTASSTTRGYDVLELERLAQQGIPALMNFRTYPRHGGWEQRQESKPWYNRSGRLEFYRDEPEFLEYGENLPVFREPVDSTFYEPNVIHGRTHPLIAPAGPLEYGLPLDDLSTETRQIRNVVKAWSELKGTVHPLTAADDRFRFLFMTPKYRHGAHSTPVDLDWMSMLFGPFGDAYRHDKRTPWVGEAYLELSPEDGRALGIDDGDYVWFDADPSDRPYRGWKEGDEDYLVSRGMARARYQNAMQPGVIRMYYNMYVATRGSVRGALERPDGLAKTPETGYQAMFRHGSHQSGVRAWLRPTLLTDTLVRKPFFGQDLGKGFESDVHCANGAPKESFIKLERAEDGAPEGGLWKPAQNGVRAGYESDLMKQYLSGAFYQA